MRISYIYNKKMDTIINSDVFDEKEIFISKYNFEKIGTYTTCEINLVKRIAETNVKITERKSLVYALFVENKCMYIGKTIQGYSRPLSYHKNLIMKDVKKGIEDIILINKDVEVFAKKDNLKFNYIDLELNLVEAIEQALISKFSPEWNNFKQSNIF
jgi:hypothetical protein